MNESVNDSPRLFGRYTEDELTKRYIALVAILATIGILVPEDVARNNPHVSEFISMLSEYIPMINALDIVGLRIEENKFVYSVLWMLFLPVAPLNFYIVTWRIKHGLIKETPFYLWVKVCGVIIFAYEMFTFNLLASVVDGDTRAARFWFGNDVGATLMSLIVVSIFYISVGGVLAMIVGYMRGKLRYLSDERRK